MSFLGPIGIIAFVLSPLLVPLVITAVHVIARWRPSIGPSESTSVKLAAQAPRPIGQ